MSAPGSAATGSNQAKDRQFNRTKPQQIRLSRVDAAEPTLSGESVQ